jgi:DNA-binding transcriptional ArsR family regulator
MPGSHRKPSRLAIDRLIHEPVRLAIVSALAARDGLTFNDLKARLGATDGNLGVHARRLEAAGYLACSKSFVGRLPRTEFRLTRTGRRAFDAYRTQLRKLVGSLG